MCNNLTRLLFICCVMIRQFWPASSCKSTSSALITFCECKKCTLSQSKPMCLHEGSILFLGGEVYVACLITKCFQWYSMYIVVYFKWNQFETSIWFLPWRLLLQSPPVEWPLGVISTTQSRAQEIDWRKCGTEGDETRRQKDRVTFSEKTVKRKVINKTVQLLAQLNSVQLHSFLTVLFWSHWSRQVIYIKRSN